MNLQSRIKFGEGSPRTVSAQYTLGIATSICRQIGVTRLADITHLDKLSIPNYSAVLPGTEDYIWVYSGKGQTKVHAQVSALMESIERFSSLPGSSPRKYVQGSYEELSKKHNVLHPEEVVEPCNFQYKDYMIMDFLSGFEMFSEEFVLVPAALALFRYSPRPPALNPFAFHHTNGLASGNVLEEAICHSLCEAIERDAVSLAQLRASAMPFHFIQYISNTFRSQGYPVTPLSPNLFKDDTSIFSDVDINDVDFQPIKTLIRRFEKARIPLIIKDITSDIGIPTFNASSVEWVSHDYGYLVEGHGSHPDSRIALLRAITEVSQTRAANIQGARDDLRKVKYGQENSDDKRAWQFTASKTRSKFSEIKSYLNEDILDDIKLLLNCLKEVGLTKVIIVNLTIADIGIPVVRAIIPGLETFKFTKSVIGPRAKNCFSK